MCAISCTPDELVGALDALGVHFLSGGDSSPRARSLAPAELLAQLAAQPDARLRLALIPLLLCQPEFASAAPAALEQLTEQRRQTFKLYYTAAVLLRWRYHRELDRLLGAQPPLPDLFSPELGLSPAGDPQEDLQRLGEQHAALTGLSINWVGTYDHAAQRLIKRLQHETLWATQRVV